MALYSVAEGRDGKRFVKYRLENRGDSLIDDVMLLIANPGTESVDLASQRGTAGGLVFVTLLPKET